MSEHWCIVATDYEMTDAWLVHISAAAEADLGFDSPGSSLDEVGLSTDWLEDDANLPGVYHLVLENEDQDVEIASIECLVPYPPLPSEPAAATSIVSNYPAIARAMKRLRRA